MTTTVDSKTRQVEIAPTDNCEDETCRTFVLHNEDHTLGNALRYMIMKNPQVDLCGYSVPHPSEKKINLRIQTRGAAAIDVLKEGLSQLVTVCDHIHSTFESSVSQYKKVNPASESTEQPEPMDT
ncbi:DNA-directed RNA polymerases I and III subunit RPAC2 [Lamellibrachia satsuma]|nr:DNA-directed RNA polymerases I and III subunit RPAC2 [Lamellibrachia satsuma]